MDRKIFWTPPSPSKFTLCKKNFELWRSFLAPLGGHLKKERRIIHKVVINYQKMQKYFFFFFSKFMLITPEILILGYFIVP